MFVISFSMKTKQSFYVLAVAARGRGRGGPGRGNVFQKRR